MVEDFSKNDTITNRTLVRYNSEDKNNFIEQKTTEMIGPVEDT